MWWVCKHEYSSVGDLFSCFSLFPEFSIAVVKPYILVEVNIAIISTELVGGTQLQHLCDIISQVSPNLQMFPPMQLCSLLEKNGKHHNCDDI